MIDLKRIIEDKNLVNELSESEICSVIKEVPRAFKFLDSSKITENIFRTLLQLESLYINYVDVDDVKRAEEVLSIDKVVNLFIETKYFSSNKNYYVYRYLIKNPKLAFNLVINEIKPLVDIPKEGLSVELLKWVYEKFKKNNKLPDVQFMDNECSLVAVSLFPQIINCMSSPSSEVVSEAIKHGAYYEFIGSSLKEYIEPNFDDPTELDYGVYRANFYNRKLLFFPDMIYASYKVNPSIIFDYNVDPNSIPEFYSLLEDFLDKKYDINFLRNKYIINDEKLMNRIVDLYIGNGKKREYFDKLAKKFGYKELLIGVGKLSYLLEPDFIEIFGYNRVYLITKYLLLSEKEFNIGKILCKFSPLELKKVVDLFIDNNSLWVKDFSKIVNYFGNNISLFKDIVNNGDKSISEEVRISINHQFSASNIESLKKVRINLYSSIDSENISFEDKIFKFLCNSNKKDCKFFLDRVLSSVRIRMLKEKYNINVPIKYRKCLLLLEKTMLLNSEDDFMTMWESLKTERDLCSLNDIINYVNNVFFKIYSNQFTDIYSLPSKRRDGVTVYELNGEDFSFAVHTKDGCDYSYVSKYSYKDMYVNEYGNGSVSTCFINQNHLDFLNGKKVLIMGGMGQMIEMGNENLAVAGKHNNDLDFTFSRNVNYLLPFEMGMATSVFNELTFYRQDDMGTRVLPVAGVFGGSFDECVEYGKKNKLTKVVRIPKDKYLNVNSDLYIKYFDEINMFNFSNFDKFIGLSKKLKKDIPTYIWHLVLSYFDDNKIEEFKFLLKKYGMDSELDKVKEILLEIKKSDMAGKH